MSKGEWKAGGRSLAARDEGSGGEDGIVLPLELVGSGIYDVAYTLSVKFGSKVQQLSLQIDTGSSDLWVASTSCSSQSCLQTNGRLYNPSGSTATGAQFTIDYLQGSATGPVVWDSVTVGGYTIENQALAAVSDVQNEPLTPDFSGILGLALPLNSIIATSLPPVTTNDADGAAWASNLFSITPSISAPASPFLSLSLSRPGSDQVPSLLGIGRHPLEVVTDPSKILYSTLIADKTGILFWKVDVRAITVYANGQAQPISIGKSVTGGVFPTAVLDSGVPLILTTPTIANGIYGAIGIHPASDGLYYVPCKTPLNITMTVDSRPEIPLHPLDLTADPQNDNTADYCVGLIQADMELVQADSAIGDMILGVPFLRNVYMVMAYTAPNAQGKFPTNQTLTTHINPRLGLMSLTDPTRAMQEFNTVRVLNQPLTSNTTTSVNSTKTVTIGGAKLSIGVAVLLGLICFFVFCGFLFLVRYLLMRRNFLRSRAMNSEEGGGFMDQKAAYQLVKKGSAGLGILSEDQVRQIKYDAYKRNTVSTASSDRTRVESLSFGSNLGKEEDFGLRIKTASAEDLHDAWDPLTALDWGDDTFVGRGRRKRIGSDASSVLRRNHSSPTSSPEGSPDAHRRQQGDSERIIPFQHQTQRSVDIPLLSVQHTLPPTLSDERITHQTSALAIHDETLRDLSIPPPLPSDYYYCAKPVGSPENFSAVEASHGLYMDLPYPDPVAVPPLDIDEAELGAVESTGMAGVGTALRTNKIKDSVLLNRDSLFDTRR